MSGECHSGSGSTNEGSQPTIHAIYRTTGSENLSRRPTYYSKELCALSLRRALEQTPRTTLTVINDGDSSEAVPILEPIARTVIKQERKGNAGSYLAAVEMALEQEYEDNDWVYFVEDDYLHTVDAVACLARAAAGLPEAVAYATLYDHPNNYYKGTGGPVAGPAFVYQVGSDYWRSVTSVCMTFGARLSALRQDFPIHCRAATGQIPDDFGLWLALQGAGLPLQLGDRVPSRLRPYIYQAATR